MFKGIQLIFDVDFLKATRYIKNGKFISILIAMGRKKKLIDMVRSIKVLNVDKWILCLFVCVSVNEFIYVFYM